MKKHLFILLILFSFLEKNAAQEGIIAIARYDSTGPQKMRFDDSLLEFSGGFQAFQNLFLKEFKLPMKTLRMEKVPDGMVGFTVNLVGKIVNIEIIDSVSTEIDAEVVRVLSDISEFHPLPKNLKFAIQYNVFPDWYREFIREKEADERDRLQQLKMDSLWRSKKTTDLEKAVDTRKIYPSGSVCAGFTNMNDPLSKYFKNTFVLAFDLNFFKKKVFIGLNLQLRGTEIKQEFEYLKVVWDKGTTASLVGMGLSGGYKVIDEERLAFTPFMSIGLGTLSLLSPADNPLPEGGTIGSFVPSFGFFADYKYKIHPKIAFFDTKLMTKTIRLRLAVNPMNFKDGRKGSVVDLGIGIGFSQQALNATFKE